MDGTLNETELKKKGYALAICSNAADNGIPFVACCYGYEPEGELAELVDMIF